MEKLKMLAHMREMKLGGISLAVTMMVLVTASGAAHAQIQSEVQAPTDCRTALLSSFGGRPNEIIEEKVLPELKSLQGIAKEIAQGLKGEEVDINNPPLSFAHLGRKFMTALQARVPPSSVAESWVSTSVRN